MEDSYEVRTIIFESKKRHSKRRAEILGREEQVMSAELIANRGLMSANAVNTEGSQKQGKEISVCLKS